MTLVMAFSGGLLALPEDKVTFNDHVKPIFQQRCATCHNGSRQSGGLDVTNYTNLMQGGGSGQSIEAGDAGASYLYLLVNHDETPKMPPSGTKIPSAEIRTIEAWINGGALENSGSVAMVKKKVAAVATVNVGVRPSQIAFPLRMSLQPHFFAAKSGVTRAIATNPWAPLAALGTAKQILLYDIANAEFLGALPFDSGRATVLKFSPNGKLLLAAGGRQGLVGSVFLWDTESTELVAQVGEETDTILAADLSADHELVALGGPQKMLRVYSVQSGKLAYEKKKHTDWVTALSFSPDGVLLASGDRNGGVVVWEAESGNEYIQLAGHGQGITGMSWRHDANVLATCSEDGTIKLWGMENGSQIKSWSAHANGVTAVDFARDGSLVSVGRESTGKLWKQDGKMIRKFNGLGEFGVAVQVCDESNRILVSDFAGTVSLFNATDAKRVATLSTNPESLGKALQVAQAQQQELREKIKPVKKNLDQANSRLMKLRKKLDKFVEQRELARNEFAALTTSLATTNQKIKSTQTSQEQWRQELEDSQSSLPSIKTAAENAQTAASQLPADKELQELAARMQRKLSQMQSRVKELDDLISEAISTGDQLSSQRTEAQQKVDSLASSLSQSDQAIATLRESQIVPAETAKNTILGQLQELEASESQILARIEYLTSEIEFDQMLAAKQMELQAAREVVESKEVELTGAKQALEAARANHDAKLSARNRSQEQAQKQEAELMKLRSRK